VSVEHLSAHRRLWAQKPVLSRVYSVWFDAMLRELPPSARVLEVGAGPGFFAEHAARHRPDLRWISSDLLATPWNHLVADALRLPIRSRSVDAIVGLDFIHHLARPADFFRESARVLVPGGGLIAVEPWVTPLSYPVYRFLHQERCRLGIDPWAPFADVAGKEAFDGDAAIVSGLVRRTPATRWHELGLLPPSARTLNGFAYLLSLGFKSGCLLPKRGAGTLLRLDEAARGLSPWLGFRAQVEWKSPPGPTTARG
jgi:SAM-dependent methyltransferase